MSPLIYIFVILAIAIFIVAEVLIAYQKYQMKKQFEEELDRLDNKEKKDE